MNFIVNKIVNFCFKLFQRSRKWNVSFWKFLTYHRLRIAAQSAGVVEYTDFT